MVNSYSDEKWLQIRDFNDYMVSNYGRLLSYKRNSVGTVINTYTDSTGLQFAVLYKEGKRYVRYIHKLVFCAYFKIYEYDSVHVEHISNNLQNNHISNLQLVEPTDNQLKNNVWSNKYYLKDYEVEEILNSKTPALFLANKLHITVEEIHKVRKTFNNR